MPNLSEPLSIYPVLELVFGDFFQLLGRQLLYH